MYLWIICKMQSVFGTPTSTSCLSVTSQFDLVLLSKHVHPVMSHAQKPPRTNTWSYMWWIIIFAFLLTSRLSFMSGDVKPRQHMQEKTDKSLDFAGCLVLCTFEQGFSQEYQDLIHCTWASSWLEVSASHHQTDDTGILEQLQEFSEIMGYREGSEKMDWQMSPPICHFCTV